MIYHLLILRKSKMLIFLIDIDNEIDSEKLLHSHVWSFSILSWQRFCILESYHQNERFAKLHVFAKFNCRRTLKLIFDLQSENFRRTSFWNRKIFNIQSIDSNSESFSFDHSRFDSIFERWLFQNLKNFMNLFFYLIIDFLVFDN